MTRFDKELLIFTVFLRIFLRSCASIHNIETDNQFKVSTGIEDEINFTSVGNENISRSSIGIESEIKEEELDIKLFDLDLEDEVEEVVVLSKSTIITGSYCSLSDRTTVDSGFMFDSIFSAEWNEAVPLEPKIDDLVKSKVDAAEKNGQLSELKAYPALSTSTIISDTVSEESDRDDGRILEDCFQGRPVHRYDIEWIRSTFIPYIQGGNPLLPETLEEIVLFVEEIFSNEATIVKISIDFEGELIVVGDVHGQLDDLVRIFEQNGYPSPERKFIFNGDIIDRGYDSIGCLLTLFMMKICVPTSFFITRGNHESHSCGEGTFKQECFDRIHEPLKFFLKCHEVFDVLPLGYIVQNRFFVCHGGLPEDFDLNWIRQARKPHYTQAEIYLVMSMLWNDPHDGLGMIESKRGGSTLSFGSDVTRDFLKRHNFDLLIRSHEYHMEGYCFSQNNLCLTIFSAPNYCGISNKGVVMKIKPDLRYEIVEIVTPKLAESFSFKRSKERAWTLNLEEADNDAVLVFPSSIKEDEEAVAGVAGVVVKEPVQDSSMFSWANLFSS